MSRGFIAYYINTDDAKERRSVVERQIESLGLKGFCERVVPVELAEAREVSKSYQGVLANNGMLDAEISLFLTNEFILTNHDTNYHAIIFEDDFVLSPRGLGVIDELCMGNMEEDLCFLDCSLDFHNILEFRNYLGLCEDFHSRGNLVKLDPKAHYVAGANAILYNKKSVEKIVNLLSTNRLAGLYDLFLRHFLQNGELRGSIIFPFLVSTSELGDNSQLASVSVRPFDDILQKFRNCFSIESKRYREDVMGVFDNDLREYIFGMDKR